ncbi:MAG: hypoxanthine phosphoribosyltransferase [Planctomycetes bacterium]|nr:hypoxanthine phosphoribosyltransferase [Planctomycetota bacterium]
MSEPNLEPGEVVVAQEAIARRLPVLAAEIAASLGSNVEGLVIMPVLTGALVFAADLIRCMPNRLRVDLATVRSYGSGTTSQGPKMEGVIPQGVKGRHVLLVDDILDSGRTLTYLRKVVQESGALSVRSCVLLRKQLPAAMATPCEFVGFEVADLFVAGYGLDYDGWYRNLPDVVCLRPRGQSGAVVR